MQGQTKSSEKRNLSITEKKYLQQTKIPHPLPHHFFTTHPLPWGVVGAAAGHFLQQAVLLEPHRQQENDPSLATNATPVWLRVAEDKSHVDLLVETPQEQELV